MSKKILLIATLCMAALGLFLGELDAVGKGRDRGGGKGGGGSAGAHGHGHHTSEARSVSRSPSMSRAVIHPQAVQRQITAKPSVSHAEIHRATPQHMQQFIGKRGQVNPTFQSFDRSQAKTQIQHHLQQVNVQGGPDHRLAGKDHRVNLSSTFKDNRINANNVYSRIRNHHPDSKEWFGNDFWRNHGYYPYHYYHDVDWWRGASWAALTAWYPYRWEEPIYYDLGSPIYVDSTTNPFPDQPTIVQYDAGAGEDLEDWLPLGVFALAQTVDAADSTNSFLQIALNKSGAVGGTYYNSTTDSTYPIEGLVDSSSQRVVLKLSLNPDSPILETGLYNLTQDIAPIQMIFSDGSIQNWILVRMNQ